MPVFSHKLPPNSKRNGYDLKRTPTDKPLRGLITCDELTICPTHYWGGRTVPCEGPLCKACQENSPIRHHVYISLLESDTHDHVLFECTSKAAVTLDDYRTAHGTLKGCEIKAYRPKRIKNGRVEIIARPYDLTNVRLPAAPNIPVALCVIWQIPSTAINTDAEPGLNTSLAPVPTVFNRMNGDLPDEPIPEPTKIGDVLAELPATPASKNGRLPKSKPRKVVA